MNDIATGVFKIFSPNFSQKKKGTRNDKYMKYSKSEYYKIINTQNSDSVKI